MNRVIVDTGPIVALLHDRDRDHDWAVEAWSVRPKPLLTCEVVLCEATYLMRHLAGGREAILGLLQRGAIAIAFRIETEVLALRTLMARYASVPMSLADACLVRMSEGDPEAAVLTTDSDFRIYRRAGRHRIPVITPGEP